MKNNISRKSVFAIADYSFEFYRKVFIRFSIISLLVHLPILMLGYFIDDKLDVLAKNDFSYFVIITGLALVQIIYGFVIRPLMDAYMIMKLYVTYTNSVGGSIYKLTITMSNLVKRIPGLIAYMMIMMGFVISSIFVVMPGIINVAFFVLGYDKLSNLFPEAQIPLRVDFWSGVFIIFLSFALFKWIIYIMARMIFGVHAMFIDNLDFMGAIRKSMELTKNSVMMPMIAITIGFVFQCWMALSAIALLVPGFIRMNDSVLT